MGGCRFAGGVLVLLASDRFPGFCPAGACVYRGSLFEVGELERVACEGRLGMCCWPWLRFLIRVTTLLGWLVVLHFDLLETNSKLNTALRGVRITSGPLNPSTLILSTAPPAPEAPSLSRV